MRREEFEARLLHDAELRQDLDQLRELGNLVCDLQERLNAERTDMHNRLLRLSRSEGVPNATLARLIRLTPQRVSQLLTHLDGVA